MIKNNRLLEIGFVSIILITAAMLRMYHIDKLTIFLSDQAIDSFAVKHILAGHLTLLGPRASVGQFFNGPIVYYLMLPFYYFFHNDPLAGTFFQITLQIATIPILYLLTKGFGGMKAGLMSIVIFAFSPLLIGYSRATFNSYPAIFFTTAILYIITITKPSNMHLSIAGVLAGMLVQMHYFLYLYVLSYFVYILLQSKSITKCVVFLAGSIIGLSPFLLFEFRHNFFNIGAIISSSNTHIEGVHVLSRVWNIGTAIGSTFGISATAGLSLIVVLSLLVWKYNTQMKLTKIFVITLCVLFVSVLLYKGILQTHYIIGCTTIIIVAFSVTAVKLVPSRIYIVIPFLYIAYILIFQNNIFALPAEQEGLGLADERVVAKLISLWKQTDIPWNVTQDAQRDNRAMPLRYLLSLDKSLSQPLPVEDYRSNKELFIVMRSGKEINSINTWEVKSFGNNYQIIQTARINSNYSLYYLRR